MAKVKKGWLAVRVGLEEDEGFKRFTIPISYLHHPLFKALLDTSREVYGYPSSGPLKLPCSVDDFLHVRWLIEREAQQSHSTSHHGNHYLHSSSFSPVEVIGEFCSCVLGELGGVMRLALYL